MPAAPRTRAARIAVALALATPGWAVALTSATAATTPTPTPGSATPSAATPSPAAPTLIAAPAAGLAGGQFVKLTFSGFAPLVGVVFRECLQAAKAVGTDCTPQSTTVSAVADGNGAGQTFLPVQAGVLADDAGTGHIECDHAADAAGHPCAIVAMHDLTDLSQAAFAPITFAPSKDDCPPPATGSAVLGAGSASAYLATYAWESAVCLPPRSLSVTYTVKNSPDGITSFFNGLVDFAVTGPFATPPSSAAHPFHFAPLTSSAVVLAYRIYDVNGPQVTSLTLTPDQIARIFTGQVPNWAADASITALNPGVTFPGRIVPFVRAEHAAQSAVFTSWLAVSSPIWKSANPSCPKTSTSPGGCGTADIFPAPPTQVQPRTGSDAMGLAVADPTTDFFNQGNIGFMDSSTAAFYGLPTARIQMPSGSVLSATPQGITQAVADAAPNADGTVTVNRADPNPAAYPMAIPTYLTAPTSSIDPVRGATLAAFLRYAVQEGQSALSPGYAPLPAALVATSLKAADAIPGGAQATATATPTPPSGATTPPATPSAGSPALGFGARAGAARPWFAGPLQTAIPAGTTRRPAPPKTAPSARPPAAVRRARVAGIAQVDDWPVGHVVLPALAGVALVSLVGGAAAEITARRRRAPQGGEPEAA